jgi:hypothetical protein
VSRQQLWSAGQSPGSSHAKDPRDIDAQEAEVAAQEIAFQLNVSKSAQQKG